MMSDKETRKRRKKKKKKCILKKRNCRQKLQLGKKKYLRTKRS